MHFKFRRRGEVPQSTVDVESYNLGELHLLWIDSPKSSWPTRRRKHLAASVAVILWPFPVSPRRPDDGYIAKTPVDIVAIGTWQYGCQRRFCATVENVEDTRDVSDTINYLVDGNELTDLTTCMRRDSEKSIARRSLCSTGGQITFL